MKNIDRITGLAGLGWERYLEENVYKIKNLRQEILHCL